MSVHDGCGEESSVSVSGVRDLDHGRQIVHVVHLRLGRGVVVPGDDQVHVERGLKTGIRKTKNKMP